MFFVKRIRKNKMKAYLSKNDFISESFYIDPFNLERIFKDNTFTRLRIKNIKVGKIIMPYPGAYIKLEESPVYKFLSGEENDINNYAYYCEKYGKANSNRTVDSYKTLINEFTVGSYDINRGIIVVNQANVLLDGQHRSCLLLNKYGRNHIIQVLEVSDVRCTLVSRLIILKDIILRKKITSI